MKTATVLTEAKVIEILNLLKQKVPHHKIAEQFGISKKTVGRINTGETWKEVSMRYNQHVPGQHVHLPTGTVPSVSPEICDILDELTAIKNHFGFDFNQPLYWGWFESWDGIHSVVSDGYIIWESQDLVKYAKRLIETGIEGAPVYASKAEELPTFELEDLMTQPVGQKYTIDAIAGDIVRLSGENGSIFLKQKYVNIANRLKLEIRGVGDKDDYVYFTHNKPKSPNNPMPIVIACVVTIKEEI
jgi:hypothetical protein